VVQGPQVLQELVPGRGRPGQAPAQGAKRRLRHAAQGWHVVGHVLAHGARRGRDGLEHHGHARGHCRDHHREELVAEPRVAVVAAQWQRVERVGQQWPAVNRPVDDKSGSTP
jgi:hypothetical protein